MAEKPKVRMIPLGGVDEIGKNMTVFEYGDDIIVVDCGLIFPQEDMLGIDLVIPDITYLTKNRERVRAFFITHGHEDHIGAIPYILQEVPAPVYGTRLTMALVENKLKEHKVSGYQLNVVKPGDTVCAGSFSVGFLKVSHSIAGAVALAIESPAGTILHTGDFKIDYTPIDGESTDLSGIAALGNKGLLALLADSTNVERAGFTMTERNVMETFKSLFRDAKGRIIIASFASNVSRIQMVVDVAVRFGRKIAFVGRSMVSIVKIAMQLGELRIPEGRLLDIDDLDRYNDEEIVIMTTGSQGEPMSGLMRMAYGEHRKVRIKPSDLVILSSSVIPGNEKFVSRVINQLYRCGATVIYESLAEVHVSGHACREELKIIHTLAKPRYFIPVHGEYRHLCQHAKLAVSLGMSEKNVIIPELGSVIELSATGASVVGSVPSGSVLVDGLGIGDVGNVVLRDRKHLSQDGLIIVVMAIDCEQGVLVSGPDIISRGFVYVREAEELMENVRNVVRRILGDYDRIEMQDWNTIKARVRDELHKYIYEQIKRNPMILPIMVEI
ncbi:MAG TPA: ribonuclease J [Candidatus Avichristensenella intestinipullorum]|uniref:Ribonuclease J n=1 Tax=Candidatus Avichristensenella intestinipullorum TaxID=2840693 RepID=A0A9D0YUW2_9FIRM|nr:ribonuclease J [Candidatus Avichristensenella intestinipullorum]